MGREGNEKIEGEVLGEGGRHTLKNPILEDRSFLL
jgi:hypothetical protein